MKFEISMLDELAGFMHARIILTAGELDVFTALDQHPCSAEELAEKLQLDARATTRLLDCLTAFDILTKKAACYSLTERGAVLSARHQETILPMLLHMNAMWENWSRLTDTVRLGINPGMKPVLGSDDAAVTAAFIGAMQVVGKTLASDIAGFCDLPRYRRLLDIGGGSGVYTIAFLRRNPAMTAVIFDLPQVLPITARWVEQAGMRDRITLVEGDFYQDELPSDCDCALLSAIIHQNSPEQNIELFQKIHRSITSGGCLLIRDHIMDASRTKPLSGAVFAINMLVGTPCGDTYTFEEVCAQLVDVGFTDIKLLRSGERMDCVVAARKP